MGLAGPGFIVRIRAFLLVDSNKKHNLNIIYGEERPFVMTGQYEKFFHGYLSVQLLKSKSW
jgi:Na+-transporting NADH:ubiquinone oxidoreductase subunit A